MGNVWGVDGQRAPQHGGSVDLGQIVGKSCLGLILGGAAVDGQAAGATDWNVGEVDQVLQRVGKVGVARAGDLQSTELLGNVGPGRPPGWPGNVGRLGSLRANPVHDNLLGGSADCDD